MKKIKHMEPKIGDRMKVSPQLTDQADWIEDHGVGSSDLF